MAEQVLADLAYHIAPKRLISNNSQLHACAGVADGGGEPAEAVHWSASPPANASTAGQHMLPPTEPDAVSPDRSRQTDPPGNADQDAGLAGMETDQPAAEAAAHAVMSAAPACQQAQVGDEDMLQDAEPAGMAECEPHMPPTERCDGMQPEEACQELHITPHDANSTMAAASCQAQCKVPAGDVEVSKDHMDVETAPAAPNETALTAAACGDHAPAAGKEVEMAEQVNQQSEVAVMEHTGQQLNKQSAGNQQSAPAAQGHAEQLCDKQSAGHQLRGAAAQGHAMQLHAKQSTGNQESAAIDIQSATHPLLTGGLTLKPLQLCMASCGDAAISPVMASQSAFGSPLSQEQPGSAGLNLNPQPLTSVPTAVAPGAASASVRGGLSMLFMPLPAAKLAPPASTGKQPMAGSSRPVGGWFDGSAVSVSASPAARSARSGPSSRPLAQAPSGTPGPNNLGVLRRACASPTLATPAQVGSGASLATAASPMEACGAATPGGTQLPPTHAVTQHAAAQSRLARSTKASSLLQDLRTAAGSQPESAPLATAAPQAQQPVASLGAKLDVQGVNEAQQPFHTPAPMLTSAAAIADAWPASRAGTGKGAEQSAGLEPDATGADSATHCSPAATAAAPVDTSRAKDMVVYSKRLEDVRSLAPCFACSLACMHARLVNNLLNCHAQSCACFYTNARHIA